MWEGLIGFALGIVFTLVAEFVFIKILINSPSGWRGDKHGGS